MPFKKGQSGNPSGRPKKTRDIEAMVRAKLEAGEKNAAIEGLWAEATNPDNKGSERNKAWELLMAYAYGKPRQRVEHSGPEGGSIKIDPTRLSDEQLAAIAIGEGTSVA